MRIPFSKINFEEFRALKTLEKLGFNLEVVVKLAEDSDQDKDKTSIVVKEVPQKENFDKPESFKPPKEKLELLKKKIYEETNISRLVEILETHIVQGRGKRKQINFKELLQWLHHSISLLKDTNFGVLAAYKNSVLFWNHVFFLLRKNVQNAPNMAVYPSTKNPYVWLYNLIHRDDIEDQFVYLAKEEEFNQYIPISHPLSLLKENYIDLCEVPVFLEDKCELPEEIPEIDDKNKYVLKNFINSLKEITSISKSVLKLSEDKNKYMISTKDTILILASFR